MITHSARIPSKVCVYKSQHEQNNPDYNQQDRPKQSEALEYWDHFQ